MKKIIILFILISSISCKKGWLDYTKKYTGNFVFTTEYTFFNMSDSTHFETTEVYNGTITKIERGMLKIKFGSRSTDFFNVEVDKQGDFSEGVGGGFSDKNNLTIYYRTGGMGGGGRYDITGVRR